MKGEPISQQIKDMAIQISQSNIAFNAMDKAFSDFKQIAVSAGKATKEIKNVLPTR